MIIPYTLTGRTRSVADPLLVGYLRTVSDAVLDTIRRTMGPTVLGGWFDIGLIREVRFRARLGQ